jgi:hypothetical protein
MERDICSDNHVTSFASIWSSYLADMEQRELERNKTIGRQNEGFGIFILTIRGTVFLGLSMYVYADICKTKISPKCKNHYVE